MNASGKWSFKQMLHSLEDSKAPGASGRGDGSPPIGAFNPNANGTLLAAMAARPRTGGGAGAARLQGGFPCSPQRERV